MEMTVQDLLTIISRSFFLLLGSLSFLDYLRQREAIKRDIMFAVGSIALNTAILVVASIIPVAPFVRTIGTLSLLAQPFLFLRLSHYLQPVPRFFHRIALTSMLFIWALHLSPIDTEVFLVFESLSIIVYFVIINSYVMLRFVRSFQKSSGILRQRLLLYAMGTGLLAAALFMLVPFYLLPDYAATLRIPVQLTIIAAALSLLLGISPPRWLQQYWQLSELKNFLIQINQDSATAWLTTKDFLSELALAANRITGGIGSLVLEQRQTEGKWQIVYLSPSLGSMQNLEEVSGFLKEAWQKQTIVYQSKRTALSPDWQSLLEGIDAQAFLLLPIRNPEYIVLVFLAQPLLFSEDDRRLMALLAQQAGAILENIDLVEQLKDYSEVLEQKVRERTLEFEKSEERFRSIFEQAAVGIAEVSLVGQFLELNQRFCEIIGYSKTELLALSFQEITHPDDLEADLNNVQALIAGAIPNYAMQKRYYHKQGHTLWINLTVSIVREASGKAKHFISVIEDITDYKLVEAAQQQIKQRFARVMDTMAEAFIMIDSSQHILRFNQSAEHMFGYSQNEIEGQSLDILLPPEVVSKHSNYIKHFAEEHDIARGMGKRQKNLSAQRKDGSIFPIEASISKLTEKNEIFLSVFIRDISEEAEVKAALLESEDRYHNIIDNMMEGFQILGFDWTYLYLNDAAALHGRVPKEELIGYTMLEKYPGIEATEMFQLLSRCMTERVNQHAEYEFAYADGTSAWFELSIQPVPEGIFVLSLEITARKHNEEAMREMNEILENRVKERTSHLEVLNKELEAFSYSVSHDLRAPLRALDGFSQALLEDYSTSLDSDGREYLDLIRFESQRMGRLIDDLIGLARLSRQDLHRENVDVSAMVHEIAALLKSRDSQRNVDFVIQENVLCCADPRLVNIVLQNLLGNAWKYSGKVPQARIEFGMQENNLFVRDNGVGFNMAYAHKLFGAFQRLHGATEFEGTGIGLATVQRIIHRHGGFIRAESLINEGASFYFTFGDVEC